MRLSQAALDAGAQAVIDLATQAGFGSFINMDQARAVAAAVIRASDAARAAQPSS